jgi:hypothetical protein
VSRSALAEAARGGPLPADAEIELAIGRVREALRGLSFGQVTIVIHDGAVVQVERTEKIRIPRR